MQFYPKIVTKLSEIWVGDPGSEIRKKHIPDPGVKKAPDPGSESATLVKRLTVPSNLLLSPLLSLKHQYKAIAGTQQARSFCFDKQGYKKTVLTCVLFSQSEPTRLAV